MADFNAGVTPADVAPGVEDTPGSGAVGVVLHNADENQSVYVRLAHTQLPPVATDRGIRVSPGGQFSHNVSYATRIYAWAPGGACRCVVDVRGAR